MPGCQQLWAHSNFYFKMNCLRDNMPKGSLSNYPKRVEQKNGHITLWKRLEALVFLHADNLHLSTLCCITLDNLKSAVFQDPFCTAEWKSKGPHCCMTSNMNLIPFQLVNLKFGADSCNLLPAAKSLLPPFKHYYVASHWSYTLICSTTGFLGAHNTLWAKMFESKVLLNRIVSTDGQSV